MVPRGPDWGATFRSEITGGPSFLAETPFVADKHIMAATITKILINISCKIPA
jgi:hypothetical protein